MDQVTKMIQEGTQLENQLSEMQRWQQQQSAQVGLEGQQEGTEPRSSNIVSGQRAASDQQCGNNHRADQHHWIGPPRGSVKINCDASWDSLTGEGGICVIARDYE